MDMKTSWKHGKTHLAVRPSRMLISVTGLGA